MTVLFTILDVAPCAGTAWLPPPPKHMTAFFSITKQFLDIIVQEGKRRGKGRGRGREREREHFEKNVLKVNNSIQREATENHIIQQSN